MLWWVVWGLLFFYALVLTVLFLRRRQAGRIVVILQISPECPVVELEWIMYSFRRFLDRELPGALWWVAAAATEQQAILFRLAGRFAYRLAGCYNQEKELTPCYRFTADSAAAPVHWLRELQEQGGRRKADRSRKWQRNISKN